MPCPEFPSNYCLLHKASFQELAQLFQRLFALTPQRSMHSPHFNFDIRMLGRIIKPIKSVNI